MCQVDEDYDGLLESGGVCIESRKCNKCKEGPAVLLLRPGETFCRACFKELFVHKFRAMLGKNRVIVPGEKVLLAVSGGASSCSMLHQIQEGLSQNAHKKLRFSPGIIYIDEGCVLGRPAEDRQTTMAQIQALFENTGFPFHILPLEEVLALPSSVLEPGLLAAQGPAGRCKAAGDVFLENTPAEEPGPGTRGAGPPLIQRSQTERLHELFSRTKSLTAQEDLLSTLRQHLLVATARAQGYSKLMLGDSCTRLAVKLLANIAMGRGAQLAVDTAFCDPRYGDVVAVKPMRDYSAKEISLHNHMWNVPCVFTPSLETKTADKSSIQRLTESFVVKLQTDFPSTVSTIYRTGEKLQTASSNQDPEAAPHRCLFCLCTLDTTAGQSSALQATLVSEQLSQSGSSGVGRGAPRTVQAHLSMDAQPKVCSCDAREEPEPCGGTSVCCSDSKGPEPVALGSLLCYSCQQTVRDMASVEFLPQYITSEANRRVRRSQMRQEISEFLLNEDPDSTSSRAES